MKLALSRIKRDGINCHLQFLLILDLEEIFALLTRACRITLLILDQSTASTPNFIGNIEAILLDEVYTAALLNPSSANINPSFQELNYVAKV